MKIAHIITDLNGFGGTKVTLIRYLTFLTPLQTEGVYLFDELLIHVSHKVAKPEGEGNKDCCNNYYRHQCLSY